MRDPNQVAREEAGKDLLRKLGLNESLAQGELGQDIANGPEQTPGIGYESFDDITGRYQRRGADLQHRTGPTLDETQANQSRGMQLNALEMLRRQGSGEAPSAAAIMSQRANQNAVMQTGQQMTGARNVGGALAALRMGAGASLGANAANAAGRAGEVSQGQGAYMGGTTALRGGDINAATQNAQLAAGQRSLNEAAQQNYEGMSRNARYAQQHAGQLAQGTHNQQVQDLAALKAAEKDRERAVAGQMVGTMSSVGQGAISAGTAAARKKNGA